MRKAVRKTTILLISVIVLYAIIVFNYPVIPDEAGYSLIGKGLDHAKVYQDIADNKPPGIHTTIYLISKLPFDLVLSNRVVVFLITLATSFITFKLSEKLFGYSENSIYIPIFYILASVLYLAGLAPLTETFETFFLVLATYVFFSSREKDYETKSLLLSSFLFFIAFQYKQISIIFLLIPLLTLFFDKKPINLLKFISVFFGLFFILLVFLNSSGILSNYLYMVWFFNFESRGVSRLSQFFIPSLLLTKILLSSFILPVLLPSLSGILKNIKNSVNSSYSILIPTFLVFILTIIIAHQPAFRFYLIDITPFLLIFVANSKNSIKSIFRSLFYFSLFLLILFSLFVFCNIFLSNGGHTLHTGINEVASINTELEKLNCIEVFSDSVEYWYLSPQYSKNYIFSFANRQFLFPDGSTPYSFESFSENACFVSYSQKPFYSFSKPEKQSSELLILANDKCICDEELSNISYIYICHSCKN